MVCYSNIWYCMVLWYRMVGYGTVRETGRQGKTLSMPGWLCKPGSNHDVRISFSGWQGNRDTANLKAQLPLLWRSCFKSKITIEILPFQPISRYTVWFIGLAFLFLLEPHQAFLNPTNYHPCVCQISAKVGDIWICFGNPNPQHTSQERRFTSFGNQVLSNPLICSYVINNL